MVALEAPDLVRSGAVCSSWNAAYAIVRRLESPPCIFYTRAEDTDPDVATIYNPAHGTSFTVRLPDLRLRSLHGSAHGWLVAADDVSNLHLVNPVTRAHLALPPITALHHTEAASDEQGNTAYNVRGYWWDDPESFPARDLCLFMYLKAVPSCSPSTGSQCVVLLQHHPDGQLSFARLGDEAWTWIGGDEDDDRSYDERRLSYGYCDAVYNKKDGLFYMLRYGGEIITLDLNGDSPVMKRIMKLVMTKENTPTNMYLVMAPWGDLLQVWRTTDPPVPECIDSEDPDLALHTKEIQLYKDADPDVATIYNPARGTSFTVRLPDLHGRSLHGSAHGWLMVADDVANLHLVNPVTRAQLALPPITALYHTEAAAPDKQGNPRYSVRDDEPESYAAHDLRLLMYLRAVPSCSPSAGSQCVVLLLHHPDGELSFARLGDKDWTWITWIGDEEDEDRYFDEMWFSYGYCDAVYNKDGLFYVLRCGGDIITLDLNGDSPVMKKMLAIKRNDTPTSIYLIMAPWGDLLQVWRTTDPPDIDSEDLCLALHTVEIELYKVDIENCAYLTHDDSMDIWLRTNGPKEIGVWNFRSGTLENVDDNTWNLGEPATVSMLIAPATSVYPVHPRAHAVGPYTTHRLVDRLCDRCARAEQPFAHPLSPRASAVAFPSPICATSLASPLATSPPHTDMQAHRQIDHLIWMVHDLAVGTSRGPAPLFNFMSQGYATGFDSVDVNSEADLAADALV
nr:unnamed protein product [Digitaria exilis]